MSRIALSGNASGTGVFTFASPNSNTDRTLDIPDASGTIDRLNRAGNVLQVVSMTNTTEQTVSSASWVDTNLTLTITPSATSSKILLQFVFQNVYIRNASAGVSFRFVRNGTAVFTPSQGYANYNISAALHWASSDIYLDSPATTSAITYKVQVRGYDTNQTDLNDGGAFQDKFIAMEIAG